MDYFYLRQCPTAKLKIYMLEIADTTAAPALYFVGQ